jgi:hypothetical protein
MKQEKWKRNLAQFKEAAPAESCSLANQFFFFLLASASSAQARETNK